ncbi:MAG: hypothetical protein IE890_10550 [Arcobacter sp.]|nr:hypothetical protein [Arcobacter sp.]
MEGIKQYIRNINKDVSEDFLNEITAALKFKNEHTVRLILAIIANESSFKQFAVGDNGYSIGLGQISIARGKDDDKISTFESILANLPFLSFTLNFDKELKKYRENNWSECKLFDVKTQIAVIDEYLNMINFKIRVEGKNLDLTKITYLYNAGIFSDLNKIEIWLSNYPYYINVEYWYNETVKYF